LTWLVSSIAPTARARRHVGQEAGVLVDVPALLRPEVVQYPPRRLEGAVAVGQGDGHSGVAEADDVCLAVPVTSARKRGCCSTRQPWL
jgi:hypothetical protein